MESSDWFINAPCCPAEFTDVYTAEGIILLVPASARARVKAALAIFASKVPETPTT